MMNKLLAGVAAGALLFAVAPVFAQSSGNLSQKDQKYMTRDAHGSAYEKALSELALQQATSPEIKQFAQLDIADHSYLNQRADQIAQQGGMTLPTTPTAQQRQGIDHLKSLSGQAFDTAYIQDMKRINSRDKTQEQAELQNTQDQQVKRFVQDGQAMDQTHDTLVQNLQTAQNDTGNTTGGTTTTAAVQ